MTEQNLFESADRRFEPVRTSTTFNRIVRTLGLHSKKMLDLGCGYGEYLVAFGPDSMGVTTTLDEVAYGKARGIRIIQGNAELLGELHTKEQFEGIWSNNLFEHLLSPHSFLVTLKTLAQPDTLLVLGVPVVPRITTLLKLKKFRGSLAAAHINFFTRETLKITVERAGWKVKEVRSFTFENKYLEKVFSLFAPHLYVVAYNDAGFTYPEKKLKEWQNEPLYAELLKIGNRG